MKKIYLSILCLSAFAINSIAQSTIQSKQMKVRGTVEMKKAGKITNQNVEKATPLWSNDFSDPADWFYSNTSTPSGDWTITTTTADTIGYGTGAWANAAAVSDENGYALFDSDEVGDDGGNQNAILRYGENIDLSAYPNVTIDFTQRIRKFNTTRTIVELVMMVV